jgi:DNA-binding transcriptional LysR family regulator
MELRQIRYLTAVAEELHFGRAAAREHIVQSALSEQVKRLERELGIPLLERDTHHVKLTAAGAAFLVEARQILAQIKRAAAVARAVGCSPPELRVGILDASYDSMPRILRQAQDSHPGLVIHQVEASEPDEYQMLADGRLDVGIGRPALVPESVASRLVRRDMLGILVPDGHRFCGLSEVRVADLAGEALLFGAEARDPGPNQFVAEMCRSAGFVPAVYAGTVVSIRAAGELVAQGRCVSCVPFSCTRALPGTTWRPLTEPVSYYRWSILWRAGDVSDPVKAILTSAQMTSKHLGWLTRASYGDEELRKPSRQTRTMGPTTETPGGEGGHGALQEGATPLQARTAGCTFNYVHR